MERVIKTHESDAILAAGLRNRNMIHQVYGAAKMAKQLGAISSHELARIKQILFEVKEK